MLSSGLVFYCNNKDPASSKAPGCLPEEERPVLVAPELFWRRWRSQPPFSFLFPHRSAGGDHNLSSVTTLPSEYALPRAAGWRVGSQRLCAALQRLLVAAAGSAGSRAAQLGRVRQGALRPRGAGPALLGERQESLGGMFFRNCICPRKEESQRGEENSDHILVQVSIRK